MRWPLKVFLTQIIPWFYALKSLYTVLWHTLKEILYGQFKPQTSISTHLKHGNKRQKYRVIMSLCFLIILYLLMVCPACGIALKKWGGQHQWSQQILEEVQSLRPHPKHGWARWAAAAEQSVGRVGSAHSDSSMATVNSGGKCLKDLHRKF